jgi:hypothetical protein
LFSFFFDLDLDLDLFFFVGATPLLVLPFSD